MPYRILSLDGGGTWALIQVKALMRIYGPNKTGHEILREFDMAAANSGGSIVLGGLLEDLPLQAIMNLFQDVHLRRSIFSPTHNLWDRLLEDVAGIGPKYSADNKLPALQHALPRSVVPVEKAAAGIRQTGSNADIHLLFVAFDYDRNRAKYFRSAKASGTQFGNGDVEEVTVADAIHASTNAPVNYFDFPARYHDLPDRYWDGAITGNNNPVLAAVTEAIVLGQKQEDIVALSIGTGSVTLPLLPSGYPASPLFQSRTDPGIKTDLRKLATAILDDPPNVASFLAHVMTGAGKSVKPPTDSSIVRMNPSISPMRDASGNWATPAGMTLAQFDFLAKLDMDAVEQLQVDAITKYADLWLQDAAPNQPIRIDSNTLALELGQPTFSAALAAWKAIR